MSAANSNNIIKVEPSATKKSSSKQSGNNDQRKHVKIKTEPVIPLVRSKTPAFASSSSGQSKSIKQKPSSNHAVPTTPATKIIDRPSLKQIDNQHRNSVIDKSSKFFLKTVDMEEFTSKSNNTEANIKLMNTDSSSIEELNETPTRKRSKSQEVRNNDKTVDHQQKKKVRLDVINDSSTPITSRVSKEIIEESAMASHPVITQKSNQPSTPTAIKSPLPFQPTNGKLTENITNEFESFEDIFRNVGDDKIRSQYLDVSKLDYDSWVSRGFQIVDKQANLVKRIVLVRSELNHKFNIIFNTVNSYGESLEKNDNELNNKMQQLHKLGQDIRRFIN